MATRAFKGKNLMDILMVSIAYPPDFGGAALQAIRLSESLRAMGQNIEFISDNGINPTKTEVYAGFKVTRLQTFSTDYLNKKREVVYICRLAWFILTHPRFKIIHFHSMRGLEALLFPFLRLLGKKVVLKLTLIDNDDPMTFKNRKKIAFVYMGGLRFVSHFVAISQRLVQSTLEAGLSKKKVSLIYNGVDVDKFKKSDAKVLQARRTLLGLEKFDKIFLSIGKIEYRKGYDLLIQSWAILKQQFPSSALVIVGPGNDETNTFYSGLVKYIKDHQIKDVLFVGPQKNVEDYLSVSDCFLFCSRAEGFGTVLIEAMAVGVPVVAMNIPGVTEDIISDGGIGKICYTGDPRDFAKLAIDLLSDFDETVISEASDKVRSTFDINSISKRYAELYESLFKKSLVTPLLRKTETSSESPSTTNRVGERAQDGPKNSNDRHESVS
jgi:glycosyltransferase involved in cell wall biosynthesis